MSRYSTPVIAIDDVILEAPPPDAVVDPMSWFATPGPFELEIGCGKGGFLLHRARSHPHLRLLGIEWANKYFRYCADRMARWGVGNVRVMRTDAGPFVMRNLPDDCLSALHLYHPDPWPKKRHHKRRLVQTEFVEAVARRLRAGGRWYLQTDHAEYFEQMTLLLDPHTAFSRLDAATPDCMPPPIEDESLTDAEPAAPAVTPWVGTNFETKYRREGREIYRAVYQRHAK